MEVCMEVCKHHQIQQALVVSCREVCMEEICMEVCMEVCKHHQIQQALEG
ncbi:hypothetical protein Fmac_011620 [Flemingia macrophylla]|uniref:Uncharacterized protein n=1 Tax=Flemingia macrophylla TaxID=520843 RepID=A0ABD1MN29_9FABA